MARFFSACCVLLVFLTQAAFAQFPNKLQPCFDFGQCYVSADGQLAPEIGYYLYTDDSGDEFFLMRYTIGADSIHSVSFDDFSDQQSLYGVVWVQGRRMYSESASFTFYMEDVEPDHVIPSSNFELETFEVTMSAEALLAGAGSFSLNVDDSYPMGNMNSQGPQICLSETCEIGASFNLLGLNFVRKNDGFYLELDFFETRTHLYDHYASFDGDEFTGPMFNFQSFELGECTLTGSGVLGDLNGDNKVNLLDIAPFVEVLTSGCFQFEADLFPDGQVDLLDVLPFVELLTNS